MQVKQASPHKVVHVILFVRKLKYKVEKRE